MEEEPGSSDPPPVVTATGSPWVIDKGDPATVPVPLPIILVKVDGPYTERDRKLWAFLLHAAWDDLDRKQIHEISIREAGALFREIGGEHDTAWIWESAKRLSRTVVEWEFKFGDGRYDAGITSIFAANISKEKRKEGKLRYNFPSMLIPIIKQPGRFSRLRTHFMMGLSGKHAVTLYQILEGFVNQRQPSLLVTIEDLRKWLHVKDGTYKEFKAFNQWVLKPALKEIDKDPIAAGFSVEVTLVRAGKSCSAVRFTMTKTRERSALEGRIGGKAAAVPAGRAGGHLALRPDTYEKARRIAPGWDVRRLEGEWADWWRSKDAPPPKNPDAAFLGFCRRRCGATGEPRRV